jgi:uncharacterized protein YecT (DUF1311 family)
LRALIVTLLVAAAPPQIHEPFTLLPCPSHPQTTLAEEGCYEHRIVRSDARINRHVRTVYRLLAPAARSAFATGERSWLTYRRSFCEADSSKYAGGSEEPVEFGACEAGLNDTHVRELAKLEAFLGRR